MAPQQETTKRQKLKTILRFADLEHSKNAVANSLAATSSQEPYSHPATGMPHIHNHEVGEDEVVEVLDRTGEDRVGRDGSRVALGATASGR